MTSIDLLLSGARLVSAGGTLEPGWATVSHGVITGYGSGEPPTRDAAAVRELDRAWLGPGFIDIHIHGSVGVDIMAADADGIRRLARFLASRGVTSFLATTYTMDHELTMDVLRRIVDIGESIDGGANLLGSYMEGPYVNPARRGAHREHLVRSVDRNEVRDYLELGIVRAMAFAPELDEQQWLLHELVRRGVTPIAGHTDATFAQLQQAVAAGVVATTHTFNGMRGIHHREPGAAGAALILDELVCEVISDGVHLAPELMTLFWRAKGPSRLALVTDAGIAGGLPDGLYHTLDRDVTVVNGVGVLADGTISSSAGTFDEDFRRFCEWTGATFAEAWPVASAVPARLAGVGQHKGVIDVGMDADLVVLDDNGRVLATVIGGTWQDHDEGEGAA